MKKILYVLIVLSLVFGILTGCGTKKGEEKKETELVTFPVKGEVVGIDTMKKRIIISHEEIPDYMMAMTMPFRVKDSTLLGAVHVGDSVKGTLAVSRTESWLEQISVIGVGDPAPPLTAGEITFRKLFKIGEPIPDFSLINQDGKRVKFSDFRGKVLALTFIYTRCPLPDFCIRMSDYFSRIQKTLTADAQLNNKWHLLSVSFDPKNDTPEVLKKYAENFRADFSTWDFLVEKESVIQQLGDGFELTFYDDEGGLIAHNLRTVLIDPQGRLVEIIKDNEWKPNEVVERIRELTQ